MSDPVRQQKERERLFREKDIPYGEFILHTKTDWWNRIELDAVQRRLKLRPGFRVLDAGCSDGRMLERLFLAKAGCRLTGMDFALNPLKALAAKGFFCDMACGDISALPFKDAVFDRAVSLSVVQHLSSQIHRIRAFGELNRVLRQQGRLVVEVLNRAAAGDMVEGGQEGFLKTCPDLFVHLYDEEDLRFELEQAGFKLKEIVAINNFPVRYLKKMALIGVWGDSLITKCWRGLSLKKGRFLLAVCEKK